MSSPSPSAPAPTSAQPGAGHRSGSDSSSVDGPAGAQDTQHAPADEAHRSSGQSQHGDVLPQFDPSVPIVEFDDEVVMDPYKAHKAQTANWASQLEYQLVLLTVEMNAWATARDRAVHDSNKTAIKGKLKDIHETEKHQEEERLKLLECIAQIRQALQMLGAIAR